MINTLSISEQNSVDRVIHLTYPHCSIRLVKLLVESDSIAYQSNEEVIIKLRALNSKTGHESVRHIPLRVSLTFGGGVVDIYRDFPMEHITLFEGELIFDQVEVSLLNADEFLDQGRMELVYITLPGTFEEKRMIFPSKLVKKTA